MQRKTIKHDEIAKAYEKIKKGGLAIIPSRVGYTLIGNSEEAISKMFAIKGRPLTKPCVVLTRRDIIDDLADLPSHHQPFVDEINSTGLLCGFILKRKSNPIFSSLSSYTDRNAQKPDGTSCFVIHGGEYLQYLIDHAYADGTVVVGSSANKSGTGNEGLFERIPEFIRDQVEYAIEDNEFVAQEYNPVTREQGVMVNLTGETGFVIRAGLAHDRIKELLDRHNERVAKKNS